MELEQSAALTRIGDIFGEWATANQKTLAYLTAHLARVAQHSEVNAMDVRNLAKVN